jgi:glycosyltransferase involved in cell wall biosynthesis
MNIVIATSGHPPFDERIFYKYANSLKKYGHKIAIVCSTEDINTEKNGIDIRGFRSTDLHKKLKIGRMVDNIALFSPLLIICCEPLTVYAALKYKKEKQCDIKIVYDITEYYPHQNTLNEYTGISRILKYIQLFLFNVYTSNLADYLFIGEEGKAKLYRIIAPFVKKAIVGYYPPKEYFHYSPPGYNGKQFTFCYAGSDSESNGLNRYLNLVKKASERFEDKLFTAIIIGPDSKKIAGLTSTLADYKNIRIECRPRFKYEDYSDGFKDVDLCVDLRDKNKVFNRSLPIKVFDFIASGKPFIFSNLDSFKGFEDLCRAGLLIEPDDMDSALERISLYLDNPEKLKEDSLAAYSLFRKKYNWEVIEKEFIQIIDSMFRSR